MFYDGWKSQITKYHQSVLGEAANEANYPLNVLFAAGEDKAKHLDPLDTYFKILDWLLFNIRTEEIF